MNRLVLLLVPAVLAAAASHVAAQPLATPPAAAPKEAPDPLADLIIPPAHGSPKQLTTGATRGIAVPGRPQARTVMGLEPVPAPPTPAAPQPAAIPPRR